MRQLLAVDSQLHSILTTKHTTTPFSNNCIHVTPATTTIIILTTLHILSSHTGIELYSSLQKYPLHMIAAGHFIFASRRSLLGQRRFRSNACFNLGCLFSERATNLLVFMLRYVDLLVMRGQRLSDVFLRKEQNQRRRKEKQIAFSSSDLESVEDRMSLFQPDLAF